MTDAEAAFRVLEQQGLSDYNISAEEMRLLKGRLRAQSATITQRKSTLNSRGRQTPAALSFDKPERVASPSAHEPSSPPGVAFQYRASNFSSLSHRPLSALCAKYADSNATRAAAFRPRRPQSAAQRPVSAPATRGGAVHATIRPFRVVCNATQRSDDEADDAPPPGQRVRAIKQAAMTSGGNHKLHSSLSSTPGTAQQFQERAILRWVREFASQLHGLRSEEAEASPPGSSNPAEQSLPAGVDERADALKRALEALTRSAELPVATADELLDPRRRSRGPQFPLSAARQYLASAEEHTRGLVETGEMLALMRYNCSVLAEMGAVARGCGNSPAFAPLNDSLQLHEVSLARFLPQLVVPKGFAAALEARRVSTSPWRLLRTLGQPVSVQSGIADMRSRVRKHEALEAKRRAEAAAREAEAKAEQMRRGPAPVAASAEAAQRVASSAASSHAQRPHAGMIDQGRSLPRQRHQGTSDTRSVGVSEEIADQLPKGRFDDKLSGPRLPEFESLCAVELGGDVCAVNSADLTTIPESEVNELWSWMEDVMHDLHSRETAKLALKTQAAAFATNTVTPTAGSASPHVERGARQSGTDMLRSVVAELNAANGQSEPAEESAAEREARAAMMAAVSQSHVTPDGMQRVLYLLLAVAAALQSRGSAAVQQLGVMIPAVLELLLAEIQWLLSLLQLTHGSCSPHLRALNAVLLALERETKAREALQHRAGEVQAANETFERRERALLCRVRDLEGELSEKQRALDDLEQESHLAARDRQQLHSEAERLRQVVQDLEGNLDVAERRAAATETVLRGAESFQRTARQWYYGSIATMSKGTQVASEGDSCDPRAVPLKGLGGKRRKHRRAPAPLAHVDAVGGEVGEDDGVEPGQLRHLVGAVPVGIAAGHNDDSDCSRSCDSELLLIGTEFDKLDQLDQLSVHKL